MEAEVEALDQAADEIRIMSGGFDAKSAGVWRSALDRSISSLESVPDYSAEFGFHVMTFKKEHPVFIGSHLGEAIEEPMGILATNYRLQKAKTRPRNRRHPGSWNRWNNNSNGSAMAAYQTDDICFEFRESRKCSRGDRCFAKHESRTGNACTNSEYMYLETGVCNDFKQCKSVHIWDTKKFGTKKAFLEKQQNRTLKATVGHYPAMVMRRVPDATKDSDGGFDDEQPMETETHISLCDGMGCGAMTMEEAGIGSWRFARASREPQALEGAAVGPVALEEVDQLVAAHAANARTYPEKGRTLKGRQHVPCRASNRADTMSNFIL